MTDFTNEVGSVAGTNVTPPSPVTKPSLVDTGVGVLGQVFQAAAAGAPARAKAAEDGFRSSVNGQLTVLADSIINNKVNSSAGMARIRAKTLELQSANPQRAHLVEEELASVMNNKGFGEFLLKGPDEEQAFKRLLQDAQEAGYTTADADPKQQQMGVFEYQQDQLESKKNALIKQRLDIEETQLTIQGKHTSNAKGKIELNRAQREELQTSAVASAVNQGSRSVQSTMKGVIERLNGGEIDEATALAAIKELRLQQDAVLRSAGTELDNQYLLNASTPINNLLTVYEQRITGTIDDEVMEREIQRAALVSKHKLSRDPELSLLSAATTMNPGASAGLTATVYNAVTRVLGANGIPGGKPANLTGEDQAGIVKSYVENFKEHASNVQNGTFQGDPSELMTQWTNVVKGISTYASAVENPEDVAALVQGIGDPVVGKYVIANGGVPADIAANAAIILEAQYEGPVMDAIRDSWIGGKGAKQLGFGSVDFKVKDVLEPVFRGGGLVFQPKGRDLLGVGQQQSVRAMDRIAKVVNTMIRASAHLAGHQDYQKVYEERFAKFFVEEDTLSPAIQAKVDALKAKGVPQAEIDAVIQGG